LTMLPFVEPVFGTHGRYLLARTHHLQEERAEATVHYQGVLEDHAKNVKDAALLLKQPDKLKNDPSEKARLEELLRSPPPDHVMRATFYLGVLQYEGGKFGEAAGRFAEFPKLYPNSPLRADAELRLGFCHVQLKDLGQALKTLAPLVEREKRLSDQALYWIAKAQAGAAPDAAANPAAHQQMLQTAAGTFRAAAERAQQMAGADPEAKTRRGEILLDLADTLQSLKQAKDAVGVYNAMLNEKLLPQREEEIAQRLVTAHHLAGDYAESDKAVQRFQEKYPKSTLLPAVLFRHAENSAFRLLAAENDAKLPDRAKVLPQLREETVKRLQNVIDKYPEYPQINLARYGLGLTYYRMADLDKARTALASIPGPDRNGELAAVPFIIADCLIRTAPTTIPEDALAVGKLEEQLKNAAELLDGFIAAAPQNPHAADALLKLGLCQQRMAALQGQPPERVKLFQAARQTYERLLGPQYKASPLQPQALFERAKCIAQAGDPNQASNELRRFTTDPLRKSPPAPMALLQLATLLRAQNKAAEAVDVLAKGREFHEPALAKDPQQAGVIHLLRYHHGVALREAGKLADARAQFALVLKDAGDRPEAAEAALRLGQCLKDEGVQKVELSTKALAAVKKPEDQTAALKLREEGFSLVRQAVAHLEQQADKLKEKPAAADARARMLYEAAWSYRLLAQPEIETARTALAKETIKKLGPAAEKFPPPAVPLAKVPFQPQEKKAQAAYQALVAAFPDAPLATDARFELAELYADRDQHEDAIKLLSEGLDREPPPDLTEKIRLRLGAIHAAKGNIKSALAQFDAVAANPKSPLLAQAHYRAGECLIDAKQYDQAVKRLSSFQSQPPLQNIPGLTDRALLRLGHAWANMQNWEESRRSLERLTQAFPGSAWIDDARYGMGWALQNQKQYDPAIAQYQQVVNRTATEIGAKAQLQIGLCRLEQKKFQDAANALLVVPFTYDYPELNAAALVEAARAFTELKQNDQAIRLLERVIRDHAQSPWAEAARERLKGLRSGS
jgi:TolA-binding protein